MDGSGEAYEMLMSRLREELPDIAEQIEELVAEGERVEASKLPRQGRTLYNTEVPTKASRLSKDDLSYASYGDDARLQILIDSLVTLARSMRNNRRAVRALVPRQDQLPNSMRFLGDDLQSSQEPIIAEQRFEADSPRLAEVLTILDTAKADLT